MIGTAVIIALIVAVGYLWLQQRHTDASGLTAGDGTTTTGGKDNSAAWQRTIGATLAGLGTGIGAGGL